MANEITKTDALLSLKPGAGFVLRGDVVEWLDSEQTEPSSSAIAAEVTRLQGIYDNNAYQRTRAVAYPDIGDQLDSLYHDILNNKLDKTGTWFTGITDVKNTTTLDEILLDGTDGSSTNAGDKVLLG